MDFAFIHNSIVKAGIPLVSVESSDGVAIVLRFADDATPDQRQQAQRIVAELESATTPDYARLKDLLRGGGLFAAALATTDTKAWAVLLMALESNSADDDPGRLADFYWSLHQVMAGLPLPLTPSQLQQLNAALNECGFGFQLA